MTDANGWPDASAPGVPLHPEWDGWHWMVSVHFEACPPTPVAWDAAQRTYLRAVEIHDIEFAARNWRYLGPCLLPAEVLAREAASAEAMREAKALLRRVRDHLERAPLSRQSPLMDDIRHALVPEDGNATDALARIRAEAVREGMLAAEAERQRRNFEAVATERHAQWLLAKEALLETLRRYPSSAPALAFFENASGLSAVTPNASDMQWAKDQIAAIRAAAGEIKP